jgi:hypothetical protein
VATHDYVIANGTGAAVRSDLNGALAAIVSQNSSASAPATMYAYMLWADTTAGIMKMRNGANSAWISLWELDGTFIASDISLAAGSAAAPSLFFTGDTNTGLFSPGADTVALATAGSNRLHITSAGLVGIGTSSPASLLTSYPGNVSTLGAKASTGILVDNNGNAGNVSQIGLGYTFSSTYHPVAIAAITDSGSGSTRADLHFATRSLTTDSAPETRMIIKNDGKVGIGTTEMPSDTNLTVLGNFQTGFYRNVTSGNRGYVLNIGAKTSGGFADGGSITGVVESGDSTGYLTFGTRTGGAITEKARIDSSGRLLVGTSTAFSGHSFYEATSGTYACYFRQAHASNPLGIIVNYSSASPNGTGNAFFEGNDSTTARFVARSNGGLANYSANDVNLSDRNVKKDIAAAASTWDCLKEWEIVNFRYRDQSNDADLSLGVIAQQVAESCPEVITVFQEATEDQPEKLGVKEQQMMWMAIKALQEAQLRIETLEAKVAALEGA